MDDNMKKPIIFLVELTHTYITVDAKNTPLAIGYLASYLIENIHLPISVDLFKYPEDLNDALLINIPDIIAFSNYMWNEELSHAFAKRVKEVSPETIIVFGGPNYPVDVDEQKQYLIEHSNIDFYIEGEGEVAFCCLIEKLIKNRFNLEQCKTELINTSGIHYNIQEYYNLTGPTNRIIKIEDNIPSPYLCGVMDKFFDKHLTPLMQTSRGCPYSCTFCHDGAKYSSKTSHFSYQRINNELEYIAKKSQVPSLTLADLNWGIFPQDLDVAKAIKNIQKEYGWPLYIQSATDKNQKDRIVAMSKILGNAMVIGASIQSSDEEVLGNIKRNNIDYDAILKMAKESSNTESLTFTEIILCLPGDTVQKHYKAVYDMLAAGIQDINLYQYILLPGTEGSTKEYRNKYEYKTLFRVIPRCFGDYKVLGHNDTMVEIHEVVVGNSTMTYNEYLECRKFDLTLSIFNNGEIFNEIYKSINHLGIDRCDIIKQVHKKATNKYSELYDIYDLYRKDEEDNFWESKSDLIDFMHNKGGFHRYVSGEFGRNQLHYWKSVAIYERFQQVILCIVSAINDILIINNLVTDDIAQYLEDISKLIIYKKGKVTSLDELYVFVTPFDFVSLEENNYTSNPFIKKTEREYKIQLSYSHFQKQNISAYLNQYGSDLRGLAHLTHRYSAKILNREVRLVK